MGGGLIAIEDEGIRDLESECLLEVRISGWN